MDEKVRIAGLGDEHEIQLLLTQMHSEGGLMPLDMQEASKMFHRAFNRQGGILGVIGEPGDIKAMIFLLISKFWYSSSYHLEELFNFVRPDCRKGNKAYAMKLIQFAKSCADEIKIPLTVGVLTNIRMEGKVRLYQRELGVPAGAWFVYGPTWQNELPNAQFWKDPFPTRNRIATGKDLRQMRMMAGK
jgi:hypothetical protein